MATAAPIQPTSAHNLSTHPHGAGAARETAGSALEVPRGPVTTTLSYYEAPADGAVPFNYVEQPPDGQPQRNYGEHVEKVQINDIRGQEAYFTLDNNAFEALANVPPSAERDFADDEHIKRVYYPEVEKLLLDSVPGAHKVVLFDHTIRRAGSDHHRTPVTRVHVDQTPAAAAERVARHVPDEANTLLQGRYRIINVWRPLNGPVYSFPLAVADGSSVSDDDLVSVEHRYPDRTGATAGVKYNPRQRWCYWSGMGNNERLLLKCSDSDERFGGHGRAPHTAFVDPRTPKGAPGRESIEVRALVFG